MKQPDVDQLAQVLRELVATVSRETSNLELSRTAAGTLSALERRGPLRIADLTRLEAVGQPAMTGLVQRLEAAGHVERTPDPADRRASLIAVTASGLAALEARRAQQDALVRARLARLEPDRLHALDAALEALTDLTREDHAPRT